MIFVSAIFARLSRQMTRATLTAKMALTAKMRVATELYYITGGGAPISLQPSRGGNVMLHIGACYIWGYVTYRGKHNDVMFN
jgi:hypothetical protein